MQGGKEDALEGKTADEESRVEKTGRVVKLGKGATSLTSAWQIQVGSFR
jgi:hypothetical protein